MELQRVKGSDLKVGDTLVVWWSLVDRGAKRNRDIIRKLTPYTGPLRHLFSDGAQLSDFQFSRAGMTIENGRYYEIEPRQEG